jgi:hypothetical protein
VAPAEWTNAWSALLPTDAPASCSLVALPSGSQLLAILFRDKEGDLVYLRWMEIHTKRDGSGKVFNAPAALVKSL